MTKKMTIVFLIRSLEPGGAERQLTALANALASRGHAVHVTVFYGQGGLERDLRGPILHDLHKKGRWDIPLVLLRLTRLVRDLRPDVVHGYLGTANLFLALLRPFLAGASLVWGVRASNMDLRRYSTLHRLHWWVEALFSRLATLIIYNSFAGRSHAEQHGFAPQRGTVVHNGIDTGQFTPRSESGRHVRARWGLGDEHQIIGLPARLDPMKDHPNFLRAAALLVETHEHARFVCIGSGPKSIADSLRAESARLGLEDRVIWAGNCQDMPSVYAAMDICCLSSAFGEGFPNVLGEAMACSVPCVATDAGDSAAILGDTGIIVPPENPQELAAGIAALLDKTEQERRTLGHEARKRVVQRFSLETMVGKTEALLGPLS